VLENALKYTPEGGSIHWQIQVEGDDIISIIQDTGQGIEPENLPHIFDRFFRGDKAHSREIQGTGLGLALVKAITDVYGAKIKVESAGRDKGTIVTIQWKKQPAS
jgi:signal transduction histidine kinase